MPNSITMLKADHVKVKQLLKKLESTTERSAKNRERLLSEIEMESVIHMSLEEELFYPAFHEAARKKDDKELFFEASEEHHVVHVLMPEIKQTDPSSELFGAKAKVLKEIIEHHIREEEKEMLPRAKELMNADELNELGERMEMRKQALMEQWQGSEAKRTRVQSRNAGRTPASGEARRAR